MTKDEKAEDYDRLQYEFTQISQDLKSEKRKNKELNKQLILSSVVKQSGLLKWDSTQPSFGDWLKLIGAEKMTTGDFAYRRTIVSRQWIINLYEAMYNPF